MLGIVFSTAEASANTQTCIDLETLASISMNQLH